MEQTFQTLLINSSRRMVNVYERSGLLLCLAAGERRCVEATHDGLYAPFESVEWHEDEVAMKPRDGWTDTGLPGTARLLLKNLGPNTVERRDLPGYGTIHLGRNIPVAIDVEVGHPLAVYAAMEIKVCEDWIDLPGFGGYVRPTSRLRDVWIKRPDGELERIAKEVESGTAE